MKTYIIETAPMGGASIFLATLQLADLNAGSTSGTAQQVITLDNLDPGDMVFPHGIRIDEKTSLVHAAATITVRLGIMGSLARFVALTDMKAANVETILPVAIGELAPYVNNTAAAIALQVEINVATGVLNTMTAGELWVAVPILRKRDRLTNRQA